ncbi:FAD binding domain-containing protein [Periconia macrospinosa]|uniref:FAD binding domain-containing protein n=1 Tax=Periconia macrospinosa TaxID=97972 RepID=A0A2V1D298_9PLEO|nr:FAD binding domain-containing protein [Periconia macrospinosa]
MASFSTSKCPRRSIVQLDIIVVGAGLSGLAAAISIAKSGHNVTVHEAASELAEVGAGLQLTPNCTKILQRYGLSDEFWASGSEPTSLTVHRYTGSILAHDEDFLQNMRKRYNAPFLDMHRCDLQQALHAQAKALGVDFRFESKVTKLEFEDARPMVLTEQKSCSVADLVVAADGLWSRCRSQFLGRIDPPKPTGDLAYRVVLDIEQIQDPELRRWVSEPTCHFWIGPGAHAVGYSLRGGKMYNIVLLVPDNLPSGISRQPGSIEEMKALFKGWDPILTRFLDLVNNVDKWKLMHRDEMTSWINDQFNLVFIGDACHPMLPYLAQGANSAIEDGAVLGLLLGRIKSKNHVPHALKIYEKLRKARGESIARETFKQREAFHMIDGSEQEARDAIFLSQLGKEPQSPFPSRWTCPQVQPWLYGYDAYEEVENSIKDDPFPPLSNNHQDDR